MNSEQRQTDGRPSSGSAASPYSGLDYNNPANPYLWLNAATNPAAAASLGIFSNKNGQKWPKKVFFIEKVHFMSKNDFNVFFIKSFLFSNFFKNIFFIL